MKVSVKEVMIEMKNIQGLGLLISDADVNRVINFKTRSKRGKNVSKEKLADLSNPYKFGGTIYYPFVGEFDECYHNSKVLTK